MKKLKNPKTLIPLFIILVALGAFAALAISNGHGHSHGEEHGHEH